MERNVSQNTPSVVHEKEETKEFFLFITQKALERIATILQTQQKKFFHVSVLGGGCQGLQYHFSFSDECGAQDLVFPCKKGHLLAGKILIGAASRPFLEGATLDFVTDARGEQFTFTNPNVTSRCGCGTSFSTAQDLFS